MTWSIHHVNLEAKDVRRAARFYQTILGMTETGWTFPPARGYIPAEPEKLKKSFLGPINVEWSIYLLSIPALYVLWLLVQHEPVVLLTQNIFLIVSIVSLILYSMIHKRQDQDNKVAYGIATVAILSGIVAVFANLHPPAWMADFSAAYAEPKRISAMRRMSISFWRTASTVSRSERS